MHLHTITMCRKGLANMLCPQKQLNGCKIGRLITGWCSTFVGMLARMHDICFLWLYPDVDGRFSTEKKESSRVTKHLRVIS